MELLISFLNQSDQVRNSPFKEKSDELQDWKYKIEKKTSAEDALFLALPIFQICSTSWAGMEVFSKKRLSKRFFPIGKR